MTDLLETHAEARLLLDRALEAGDTSFWGLMDFAPTIFDLEVEPTTVVDGIDVFERIGGERLTVSIDRRGVYVSRVTNSAGSSSEFDFCDYSVDASFIPVGAVSADDIHTIALFRLRDLSVGRLLLDACMTLPRVSIARRQIESVYWEALDAVEARTLRLGLWHATGEASVAADDCRIWFDKWLSKRIGVQPTNENQAIGEARL